jgi:hypothetical protein
MKYFISGHRDITNEEFDLHYKLVLDQILRDDPNCEFVVGDCYGADAMAQKYLRGQKVTVYHKGSRPRVNYGYHTKGGYLSHTAKDAAMTHASDKDIAWVRSGKENSGTAQNILRRSRKILIRKSL